VDLVSILKEFWRRRALVVVAAAFAAAAGLLAVYQVSLLPPDVGRRVDVRAQGSISILVDSTRSPIADYRRDLGPLTDRAGVFARLMTGGDVVGRIAEATGIPTAKIDVGGPTPQPGQAPGAELGPARAHPYGLMVAQSGELPIIGVLTRAPTVPEARAMAAAAPDALRAVIGSIQAEQDTPQRQRVEFRRLGPAQAGMIDDATGKKIAAAAFAVVFAGCLLAILAVPRLVAAWRIEHGRRPADGAVA
jgi:hypothetical protein